MRARRAFWYAERCSCLSVSHVCSGLSAPFASPVFLFFLDCRTNLCGTCQGCACYPDLALVNVSDDDHQHQHQQFFIRSRGCPCLLKNSWRWHCIVGRIPALTVPLCWRRFQSGLDNRLHRVSRRGGCSDCSSARRSDSVVWIAFFYMLICLLDVQSFYCVLVAYGSSQPAQDGKNGW